jgi:excisionase family DNA binding protein
MKMPPDTNHEPLAYTARQVSELLNVSTKTVYRLCQLNRLARAKALRVVRVPRWSVEQYLRDTSK